MRGIVVGGAGGMGRVAVRDLARSAGVERVTVADLEGKRATRVAEEAGGHADVRAVAVDLAGAEFTEILKGHDFCISSVAYRLNPVVAEACLAAGCHYVDLGGLFHVALEVLALGDRYRNAGLTGVTCVGGGPGITNMLAVVGARELDSVRAIHVRLGSMDPSSEGLPLPIPYSLDTILDEFTIPAMAYRDGRFVEVQPLGEPEDVSFPEPIGRRRAFTTLHSEVATLPRAFPGVEEVTFKIAFEPAFVERFQLLAAMGLASPEPLDVGGARVRPREVLAAMGRRLPQAAGLEDVECLRVELLGEKDGSPTSVVAESLIQPDREWGAGAGALDTGIPPSIVAQMIMAGEVKGPGMFAPEEAVDADRFFARLSERGITGTVRSSPGPGG
ncbi:MAG: saccharopine dehydrogenase NADP-binding domain-containing protein [Actinobacteria bacterium]|nr:saccharopine dehydrogenase NADP-binding domain-containing protein [Actinomycetota bacterium]